MWRSTGFWKVIVRSSLLDPNGSMETAAMLHVRGGTSTFLMTAGGAAMFSTCGTERLQTLVLTRLIPRFDPVNRIVRPVAIESPLMLFPLDVIVTTPARPFGPPKGPLPVGFRSTLCRPPCRLLSTMLNIMPIWSILGIVSVVRLICLARASCTG